METMFMEMGAGKMSREACAGRSIHGVLQGAVGGDEGRICIEAANLVFSTSSMDDSTYL